MWPSRTYWRDPHLLVTLLVLVWAGLVTARHQWAGDLRLHIATVHELARHPWNPVDPLVGDAEGSPYHSPYMVVLAWTTKATGLSPRTVLEVGGILSLALFAWALRRFCEQISPSPALPAWALIFTLVLWGPSEDLIWSGFFGLHSLSWNLGYPSTLAFALMLLTWDTFLRMRGRAPGYRLPVLFALLLASVVLIHPFTGVNTVVGISAFSVAGPRRLWKGRPVAALLGGAAAFVACVSWPLSDVASMASAFAGLSEIHRPLLEGARGIEGVRHYGLVVLAAPALLRWGRRPMGPELRSLFALGAGLLVTGALIGSPGLTRAVPIMVLPVHVALAACIHDRFLRWSPRRVLASLAVVLACGMGLHAQHGGLLRAYWNPASGPVAAWQRAEADPPARALMAAVRPGQVVMTEDPLIARLVNERGAFSVIPGWPYPYVNEEQRVRDANAFYAASTTPGERLAMVRRYRVSCAVIPVGHSAMYSGSTIGFHQVARTADGAYVLICRD